MPNFDKIRPATAGRRLYDAIIDCMHYPNEGDRISALQAFRLHAESKGRGDQLLAVADAIASAFNVPLRFKN
jgi:hypothetical protein